MIWINLALAGADSNEIPLKSVPSDSVLMVFPLKHQKKKFTALTATNNCVIFLTG